MISNEQLRTNGFYKLFKWTVHSVRTVVAVALSVGRRKSKNQSLIKYQWKISKFDEKIEHLSFIRILVQTYIDKFHLITHIDPLEDYSVIYLQKKPPIYNKTTRKRRRMIKNSDCWYSVSKLYFIFMISRRWDTSD